MSLIGDFASTLATRSGLTVRVGSLDPAATMPACVVRFTPGTATPYNNTQDISFQVTSYSTSQQAAVDNAETARTAIHRQHFLDLGSWIAASITCDPVINLPPMEAQGGHTYRAAYSGRLQAKPQ